MFAISICYTLSFANENVKSYPGRINKEVYSRHFHKTLSKSLTTHLCFHVNENVNKDLFP